MRNNPMRRGGAVAGLCAALVFASSCSAVGSGRVSPGARTVTPLDERALVSENWEGLGGLCAATEEERQALASMESMLENDSLALYMGATYFDIAVEDKRTGHIWFSNPALYTEDPKVDGTDEAVSAAYSQVTIRYYDEQNVSASMSSVPDAVDGDSRRQATAEVKDGALYVTYTLGLDTSTLVICRVMTEETFLQLDELGNQMAEEGTLAYPVLGAFESLYTRIDPAELSESEKNDYLETYPNLEKIGAIYALSGELNDLQNKRLQEFFETIGWTKEDVQAEEGAITAASSEAGGSACFTIPVCYRLDGGDLLVSVDTQGVVNAPGYYLERVWLLPAFGGTREGEGGYLFVPDGSGAILADGDPPADRTSLSVAFYGSDPAKALADKAEVQAAAPFPVFGLRQKNAGFFAIAESGDAIGGVTANRADIHSSYHRIGSYFDFIPNDVMPLDSKSNGEDMQVFASQSINTEFRVRYHFLYGDASRYAGMAAYYQTYLSNLGVIAPLEEGGSVLLDLDVVGGAHKKKQVAGFPVTLLEPLTTFEQAAALAQALQEAGVSRLDLRLEGWMNGGMEYRLSTEAKPESALGGKKGFQSLLTQAEALNVRVYPTVDFTAVYAKGNGFSLNDDAAFGLDKNVAYLGAYSPVTGEKLTDNQALLIAPSRYTDLAEAFTAAFEKIGGRGLAVAGFGERLASDFHDQHPTDRESAKQQAIAALEKLADRDLKLVGANAYALAYADTLVNVPTESSGDRVESYAVPFVAMVLHGFKELSPAPINLAADVDTALLQAAESGMGLHYRMIDASNFELSGTSVSAAFSISKEDWLEKAAEQYRDYQAGFGALTALRITDHRRVQEGVSETTYENGARVLVNYTERAVEVDGRTVEAGGYLCIAP